MVTWCKQGSDVVKTRMRSSPSNLWKFGQWILVHYKIQTCLVPLLIHTQI